MNQDIINTLRAILAKFSTGGTATLANLSVTGTLTVTGNTGIGTASAVGKLEVVTTSDTTGSPSAYDNKQFIVGTGGANGGNVFVSYNQSTNIGYIGALTPGTAWRTLTLNPGGGTVRIGNSGATVGLTTSSTLTVEANGAAITGNVTIAGVLGGSGLTSINVNSGANAAFGMIMAGPPTSGTDTTGMLVDVRGNSGATGSFACLYLQARTAVAAMNVGSLYALDVRTPTLGAGSTSTSTWGINVRAMTTGTTSNYGIQIDAPSGGATNNIGLLNNGTTKMLGALTLTNAIGSLASTADEVRLGSYDLSAGNATLSLSTETAVVVETVTSDATLSVRINGTTYKICLKS